MNVVRDELELKARVEDPDAVRRALLGAGAQLIYRGAMLDRRFDRKGRLAARDEVVRLRVFHPADHSGEWGVLGWKGPVGQRGGYRHREEWESRVDDPRAVLVVLRRYPSMDVLVEVEGRPDAIERAIAATGMPRDSFLPESLPYFTAAYEQRTGLAARTSRIRPT